MNELAMSRTDKYMHTIVKYHSIDGMWLNIEHIEQTVLRSKYKMTKTFRDKNRSLWTCIQCVQRNVEHITSLAFKMTCKGTSTLKFEIECMNTYISTDNCIYR